MVSDAPSRQMVANFPLSSASMDSSFRASVAMVIKTNTIPIKRDANKIKPMPLRVYR